MSWVKLDDGFDQNLKLGRIGDAAHRLYTNALAYAARNETDGFVPPDALKGLHGSGRRAVELVDAGLWHAAPAAADAEIPCASCEEATPGAKWRGYRGWVIHDFLQYNPSSRDQHLRRQDARERMADLRNARGAHQARTAAAQPAPVEIDRSPNVRANILRSSENVRSTRPPPQPVPQRDQRSVGR